MNKFEKIKSYFRHKVSFQTFLEWPSLERFPVRMILEYQNFVNQYNPGLNRVIKERFSVYEIDNSMNIAYLGDQKFPDEGVDQNIEYDDLTQAQEGTHLEILFSITEAIVRRPSGSK